MRLYTLSVYAETEHINQLNGLFENNGPLNQFRKIVEHSKMVLYHSMAKCIRNATRFDDGIDRSIIVRSSQGVITTDAQPDPESVAIRNVC